eukprot:IDg16420t1
MKAQTGRYSAQELRDMHAALVAVRRAQQMLITIPNLNYTSLRRSPKLAPEHKTERVLWARKQLRLFPLCGTESCSLTRKIFFLDRSDGHAYYWADKRLDKRRFSNCQNSFSGLMVWGCFDWRDKPNLLFMKGGRRAAVYTGVLEAYLLPITEIKYMGSVS